MTGPDFKFWKYAQSLIVIVLFEYGLSSTPNGK